MSLASDKILNILLDSLSIEELEAALAQKKGIKLNRPIAMTEKEKHIEYYTRLIISRGILYPPKTS